MRDMERYAARESEDLRRYVAFVSLYAPVLALDDAAAKKYALAPVIPDLCIDKAQILPWLCCWTIPERIARSKRNLHIQPGCGVWF